MIFRVFVFRLMVMVDGPSESRIPSVLQLLAVIICTYQDEAKLSDANNGNTLNAEFAGAQNMGNYNCGYKRFNEWTDTQRYII